MAFVFVFPFYFRYRRARNPRRRHDVDFATRSPSPCNFVGEFASGKRKIPNFTVKFELTSTAVPGGSELDIAGSTASTRRAGPQLFFPVTASIAASGPLRKTSTASTRRAGLRPRRRLRRAGNIEIRPRRQLDELDTIIKGHGVDYGELAKKLKNHLRGQRDLDNDENIVEVNPGSRN